MTAADDLPPGWLTRFRRGAVSGGALVVLASFLLCIPSFLAWFAPGANSVSATSALKAAIIVGVSGNHGGVRLDGTAVSLAPLLVTLLLAVLIAGQVRRVDSTSGVVGIIVGYSLVSAVLASWAKLGATSAPPGRTLLAAAGFATVVGGLVRLVVLRWPRTSPRWRRIAAGIASALIVYVAAGAFLTAATIAFHAGDVSSVQRQVAGGAAGLPVMLLGLAGAPNAVLYSVGYLSGPGFRVGSGTSLSVLDAHHGRLPLFPMLGAIPNHPHTVLGIGLGVLVALVAGWLAVRQLSADGTWTARLLDVLVFAVGVGAALSLLTALASGGLGSGALRHIGSPFWLVGPFVTAAMLVSGIGWMALRRGVRAAVGVEHRRLRLIVGAGGADQNQAEENRADKNRADKNRADKNRADKNRADKSQAPVAAEAGSGDDRSLRSTG
ncbi:MAG: hypothetical protein JWN95_1047 [Frankiales bacterium]|nr:hypothetical protein [Frankiales bacterium]